MSDKKRLIIETAMRCFARKGFHATSIQEIVDELGMAKGSIYFYFKSKEDLLLSVFGHYAERMMAGMTVLPDERQLSPRDQFRQQLRRHFRYFLENQNFLLMVMRESVADVKKDTMKLLLAMRARMLEWKKHHIVAIYGPEARIYSVDGARLLNGMMQEFMNAFLLEGPQLDAERLTDYLIERLDDLMHRLIERGDPPLIRPDLAGRLMGQSSGIEDPEREMRQAIRELLRLAEEADEQEVSADKKANMIGAASRLEDEIANPIPDRIIVRGMLAYMKELAYQPWQRGINDLVKMLHIPD